jgi:AcrR family transcriptional regulator
MQDHVINPPNEVTPGENRRLAALSRAQATHRQEIRGRIEDAALDLFERHGMDCVTVDQISEAAGISRRSFYRYFSCPDDIIVGALCKVMDGWASAVRSRPVSESMIESTRLAVTQFDALLEPISRPRRLFHMLEASPAAWVRIGGSLQTHVAESLRDVIAERLRHMGKDPDFAGAIAAALAVLIMWSVGKAVQERRTLMVGEIESAMANFGALVVHGESAPD